MAITFDGQNDRITTTSQGLTVPQNVSGTFQAGGLAIGAASTILSTNTSGFTGFGTANPQYFHDIFGTTRITSQVLNSSGRPILNQTGSILQVSSTIKSDVFSTTSSSMTDVTGLSASITPNSTSSRILVHYSVNMGNNAQFNLAAGDITRNGTAIALGDAAGNRQRCTFGTQEGGGIHGDMRCYAGTFLDSPSSTSTLTYQIRIRSEGGNTVWVNRSNEADGDSTFSQRGSSVITVMEVSG